MLSLSFNRTSMESKLKGIPVSCLPVHELLIEPVWNRNGSIDCTIGPMSTFNRTSMESKHLTQDT